MLIMVKIYSLILTYCPRGRTARPTIFNAIPPRMKAVIHGNAEIFLTADKVRAEELEANKDVIVENVPEPIPAQ